MKNFLLIAVSIIMFLNLPKAQAQQEGSKWINVITGLNSTWIMNQNAYGNPEIEYATTFGFTGGLGLTYMINEQLAFNAAVLGSQMGQNYSGVQREGDADRRVKLSYVEVPLQIMKRISNTTTPTWICVGPEIMVLLKAQQEYTRKDGDPLPNPVGMKNGDIRERFNTTDVAIKFSVNKMYKLDDSGKTFFLVSFDSSLGLTDMNSIDWKIPNMQDEYAASRNFYIGVKAGLMFKASRD